MSKTQQLARKIKVARYNRGRLKNILELVVTRIKKQNGGCFVDGYGVSYVNKENNTRCPIGLICQKTPNELSAYFGPIGEESQKPLVRHISKKYDLNIETDPDRENFIQFLTRIQDTHDKWFDLFDKTRDNRLEGFLNACDQIKKDFRL